MSEIERVVDHVDANFEHSLNRLFELLRIESISTDPAYAPQCVRAADWLVETLTALGFDASVRATEGHPMVVAHYTPDDMQPGTPHVLFYGHYDVQPVDPLELWETPPFEPQRAKVNGTEHIVARGAADDKGQLMTFVEASRAWIDVAGALPLRVTLLFEGEEESGSPSLEAFLDACADELKADVALVCDTNMWDAKTPAITTRLRGSIMDEVIVQGPSVDLHSGLYGGPAHNPIRILSNILAGLHDANGRVEIPGFYDGVDELPDNVRAQWDALDFDEADFLGEIGQSSAGGEQDRGVIEKIWARPTCDVNGVIGGYTGAGFKTVIPAAASAKVSCRLVGRQNPTAIRTAFREFVRARLPQGCTAEFVDHGANPAIEIEQDNEYLVSAARALEAEFGRPPVMMGCGGSIPIVGNFRDTLGMESLLIGFGLNDDRIHSPNEKYDVSSYRNGIRSWARILAALAQRA
jgi:acetylornithine deacetylase/succinyl-diaminopimelate desuccinylase-like protein